MMVLLLAVVGNAYGQQTEHPRPSDEGPVDSAYVVSMIPELERTLRTSYNHSNLNAGNFADCFNFLLPSAFIAGDSTEAFRRYFKVQIVDSIEGEKFNMIPVPRDPTSMAPLRYGYIAFAIPKNDADEVPYDLRHFRSDEFTYPIRYYFGVDVDTLEVIAELLEFRGDTTLCSKRVQYWGNYGPHFSTRITRYSIQVEALFLVNLFYFSSKNYEEAGDGFWYSSQAILVDTTTQEAQSISGAIVDRAYRCYAEWFEVVKTIGLAEARKQKIYPLTGCGIRWVGRHLR